MKPIAMLLLLLLTTVTASAQVPPPVVVEADRITFVGESVPRFLDLPFVKVVAAGETYILPPYSAWDYIEVQAGGTVRCARTYDTTLLFTHFFVLPGGVFDCGTVADPVLTRVEFIVRDVAIDTGRDIFQWGNGLLNFGVKFMAGAETLSFAEIAHDVPAGSTGLTLAELPTGWQPGGAVILPDLRQIKSGQNIRIEPLLSIASVGGNAVSLDSPVTFEHSAIRDPDGVIVTQPRIGYLSRNITIRSENPNGTRGHVANIANASYDVRYVEYSCMGRTPNNMPSAQQGRYADHDHHMFDAGYSNVFVGNSLDGCNVSKWGKVTHKSNGTLVEGNICVRHPGGCFIAGEDGDERDHVHRHNAASQVLGNGKGARQNALNGCAGCEGAGIWARGVTGATFDGNESWNNTNGIALVQEPLNVPPGFDQSQNCPASFTDNVTLSNDQTGVEGWVTPDCFVVVNHLSWNSRNKQGWTAFQNEMHYVNPDFGAQGGVSAGVSSRVAYTHKNIIEGGRIVGTEFGVEAAKELVQITGGTVLRNTINIKLDLFPLEIDIDGSGLPMGYPQNIIYGDGFLWDGNDVADLPKASRYENQQLGQRHVLKNYQGGDWRLYEPAQRASEPGWPADFPAKPPCCAKQFYSPARMTMGEAFALWGVGLAGAVAPNDAVSLPGVQHAIATPLGPLGLGTPKLVMTYPNMMNPAIKLSNGRIQTNFVATGDPDQAGSQVTVSVDGQAPVVYNLTGPTLTINLTQSSPGLHTVTTGRLSSGGSLVPGSSLTFQYQVP